MTFTDLQCHSAIASLFRHYLSYRCAVVDKILADVLRLVVHLR